MLCWCTQTDPAKIVKCFLGHRGEHQPANTRYDNDDINLQRLDSQPITQRKKLPKTFNQVFEKFNILKNTNSCLRYNFRWWKRSPRNQTKRWTKCTRRWWRKKNLDWRRRSISRSCRRSMSLEEEKSDKKSSDQYYYLAIILHSSQFSICAINHL